jgi:hypothetical protein
MAIPAAALLPAALKFDRSASAGLEYDVHAPIASVAVNVIVPIALILIIQTS